MGGRGLGGLESAIRNPSDFLEADSDDLLFPPIPDSLKLAGNRRFPFINLYY